MQLRNNILIIHQIAEEIRKQMLKPKSSGLLWVQDITDKIKTLRYVISQWTGTLQLWHLSYI